MSLPLFSISCFFVEILRQFLITSSPQIKVAGRSENFPNLPVFMPMAPLSRKVLWYFSGRLLFSTRSARRANRPSLLNSDNNAIYPSRRLSHSECDKTQRANKKISGRLKSNRFKTMPCRLFAFERQKIGNSRAFDRRGEHSLVLCAYARHSSRQNFAVFGNVFFQRSHVLIVDVIDFSLTKSANFFSGNSLYYLFNRRFVLFHNP